jgi:hypothetical protein
MKSRQEQHVAPVEQSHTVFNSTPRGSGFRFTNERWGTNPAPPEFTKDGALTLPRPNFLSMESWIHPLLDLGLGLGRVRVRVRVRIRVRDIVRVRISGRVSVRVRGWVRVTPSWPEVSSTVCVESINNPPYLCIKGEKEGECYG